MKKFKVIRRFIECNRTYRVGEDTVFDCWPEKDRADLIKKHEGLGNIEAVPVPRSEKTEPVTKPVKSSAKSD